MNRYSIRLVFGMPEFENIVTLGSEPIFLEVPDGFNPTKALLSMVSPMVITPTSFDDFAIKQIREFDVQILKFAPGNTMVVFTTWYVRVAIERLT